MEPIQKLKAKLENQLGAKEQKLVSLQKSIERTKWHLREVELAEQAPEMAHKSGYIRKQLGLKSPNAKPKNLYPKSERVFSESTVEMPLERSRKSSLGDRLKDALFSDEGDE